MIDDLSPRILRRRASFKNMTLPCVILCGHVLLFNLFIFHRDNLNFDPNSSYRLAWMTMIHAYVYVIFRSLSQAR